MTPLRLLGLLLVAALLTISACGKRGDPIRPGEEPKKAETKTTAVLP